MSRISHVTVALVATLMLAWCGSAVAGAGQAGVAGGVVAPAPQHLMVPGYWLLGQEHVQKEIGLKEDQKEKLRAISKDYYEQMRQGYQRQTAVDWQKLSEEERKKRLEAMRARSAKLRKQRQEMVEKFKKRVERVLTDKQLSALKEIEFRRRAGYMLRNQRVLEAIGLSEKQQARLKNQQERLSAQMRAVQKKAAEKALGVLTPDQMKELRKLHAGSYRSVWQRGQSQGRVKVQAVPKPKCKEKPKDEKKSKCGKKPAAK